MRRSGLIIAVFGRKNARLLAHGRQGLSLPAEIRAGDNDLLGRPGFGLGQRRLRHA